VCSLTKLWGLAGLRVGYLLASAPVVKRVRAALQPWSVSTPAAHAALRLSGAETERVRRARLVALARDALLTGIAATAGPPTAWESPANFVLLRSEVPDLRRRLLDDGDAVRRGETFPGLDASYVRVAVPVDPADRERFLAALARPPAS